jgi:PIN domain nuclease of toxin-antitoxin system
MRALLDTHILIWAAADGNFSDAARSLIDNPDNELLFSAVSLWEIAIKAAFRRPDFQIDVAMFRRGLMENGYTEIPATGAHAIGLARLPPLHKDPFDRMLLAQAMIEGLTLVTTDPAVAKYPGPIRLV